jgi:hypothetical protein
LSATEVDTMVRTSASKRPGMARTEAELGKEVKYGTQKAVVTITFRRSAVTLADVFEALDSARAIAAKRHPPEGQ